MKALSNTESKRLERMYNAEAGEQERMKQRAEATVQDVLRKAEEKFQAQQTTQPVNSNDKGPL